MNQSNLSKSNYFAMVLFLILGILNFISCDIFEQLIFDEAPEAIIIVESQYVRPKTHVQLSGEKSFVPWGNPSLTYAWEVISVPEGSAITQHSFEATDLSTIVFTPDLVGQYLLKLSVSYKNRSGETHITIHVMNLPQTPAAPRVVPHSASSVSVEWEEVPGATGYILKRNGLQMYKGSDLAYLDDNLSPNTSYSYVLVAENQVGFSDDSPVGSATTTQILPGVPTNWEFTERTSTSLTLRWDVVSDATHYKVYRNTDNGSFTNKVYEGQTSLFRDTGLEPATIYYYRIYASNGAGDSGATASIEGRTRFMPLGTPQNLRVDLSTTSSVRYIWDSVVDATGYRVEKGITPDGPWEDAQQVSATSHQRYGLQAGELLYIAVTAIDSQNPDRDSNRAKLQVQTVPAAPQNVQLRVATSSAKAIVCSWNPVHGANYYQVFRGTSPYGPWGNPIAEPQSSGYEDTGLISNTTYYYQIKAVNTGGISEASETKSLLLTETDYYTVIANVSPSDGGYVTGTGDAIVGETITLKAFANANFVFSHWDNNTNDTHPEKQIIRNSPDTVTHIAHFSKKKVNIIVSTSPSGGGSVSGGGEYAVGDWVQLTATPKSNYTFSHWDNDPNDRSNTKGFTAPSFNRSHVAHFTKKQGTVILEASPPNGGTVIGGGTYDVGDKIDIEAIPSSNYDFDGWSNAKKRYHTITVAEGTTILTASFTPTIPTYSITVSNKSHPNNNFTNSDEISIQITRSGRSDYATITLELHDEMKKFVKTIRTISIKGSEVVTYTIPNDISAGSSTSKKYFIFLRDSNYSDADVYSRDLRIYNVLDGNAKSRYIGVVPDNSGGTEKYLHDVVDWIDQKQPIEYLKFKTPNNPSWLSNKVNLAINLWYRDSYYNDNLPGTSFLIEVIEDKTGKTKKSVEAVITSTEEGGVFYSQYSALIKPIQLIQNTDYTLKVQFLSGYPTKLGYWIEHMP